MDLSANDRSRTCQLWTVLSRLYQRRFWKPNTQFAALFEIYNISHLCTSRTSKFQQIFVKRFRISNTRRPTLYKVFHQFLHILRTCRYISSDFLSFIQVVRFLENEKNAAILKLLNWNLISFMMIMREWFNLSFYIRFHFRFNFQYSIRPANLFSKREGCTSSPRNFNKCAPRPTWANTET